jgi:type IV secretory pathway VirB10-like protein
MSTRALILALLVLAEGCSFTRPVQTAPAPPEPPPNVAAPGPDRDPPAATPSVPDGAASSAPPAPLPTTSPPTEKTPPASPPIITSRVANEEQLTREVNARLAKVSEIVDRIDASKLTRDEREIFSSIQDFQSKARAALSTRDVPKAQILAEKALGLASTLAPR